MNFAAYISALSFSLGLSISATGAWAAPDPFAGGWTLDAEQSALSFLSIKDATKVETSSFAALDGTIEETGEVEITVHLESIDTKIDLRNVRMRFLFFETFLHPRATILAELDAADFADLPEVGRKRISLEYVLDLHGVQKTFVSDVIVTLLNENEVYISAAAPVSVSVADFGLENGWKKLEEAAGLPIIPSATVSFDFRFLRNGAGNTPVRTAAATAATGSRALESSGQLALEECQNRFLTVSEANEIYFASGSARLEAKSAPMLDSLAEIVGRCPDLSIEIGGHTDSVGPERANLRLSERRAKSVAAYLEGKGVENARMQIAGYGEIRPVADNSTERGRWRNRRIEFSIVE
ncbi:OmpA family protein [Aliiruegeria lutimaris]|uniref:Outer membrane protein OmpA n=1 Tax=Aliiruegeria lutimaris TaxID=571298 RepID=A0A1G8T8E9_9RHOB|nr:OmpA family protein [Aliiruegeria lutimaris]SDJ37235.1 Outer membrane protein OmpA [Aliiruegeria lutimaris]